MMHGLDWLGVQLHWVNMGSQHFFKSKQVTVFSTEAHRRSAE